MIDQPYTHISLSYKKQLKALACAGLFIITPCLAETPAVESSISDLISRAQTALATGQPQQAAEFYEQAAAQGESATAEIGLVRAYLQAGEFRKAIAFGNLVASEHADVSETAALLAYLEDREAQTTPALNKLELAIKKFPDDVAITAAHAEILIDRLDFPQAIKLLDDWISRNPPQGDIYRLRARAALAADQREDLINWRSKAVQAYETQGNVAAAKPLRDWLAKNGTNPQQSELQSSPPKNPSPTLSAWPAHYQEAFPSYPANNIKSGNGVIVDQGRHVVTNAGLVANATGDVLVRNGLGKIRTAKVEKVLADQGLALLNLDQAYPKAWSIPNQAWTVPENVHFCFVLGFPLPDALETGYPLLAPGIVVRANTGYGGLMQLTATLGADNSGSPVFDSNGTLIALSSGKQEQLKGIADREALLGKGSFAIRADALQNLLPNLQILAKKTNKKAKQTKKTSVSVEDLYEKLLPTVVTIVVPN